MEGSRHVGHLSIQISRQNMEVVRPDSQIIQGPQLIQGPLNHCKRWRWALFISFFDHSCIFCARLVRCSAAQELNEPARFIWRCNGTVECFLSTLSFSRNSNLENFATLELAWSSSPLHLCFSTWGFF